MKNCWSTFQFKIWLQIIILLCFWKGLVFLGMLFGQWFLPIKQSFCGSLDARIYALPHFWQVMSNFDGEHYLSIARRGYENLTQAFFPLYPATIGMIFHTFHIPLIISGLIVSHFSLLLGLYFAWRLFKLDCLESAQGAKSTHKIIFKSGIFFLLLILIWPTGQFYGAIYNDAMFFCLATLTLWWGRTKHWFLAGLTGGLATLTRLNGLALWPFLIVEYLDVKDTSIQLLINDLKNGINKKSLIHYSRHFAQSLMRPAVLYSLLIPAAFIGYLLYQQIHFGSWQVVFNNMSIWNQNQITFPPQVVWRYLKILTFTPPLRYQYWVAFLELGSVFVYVLALIYAWKRLRFSYFLFLFISILIPSLTGSFQGMPRYALHLYPFFLMLAIFLQTKPALIKISYLLISVLLFLFYAAFFCSCYFVA